MRGVTHFFGNFGLAHLFQLTRLMRGVTVRKAYITNANKFQLTRLMRGVTFPPNQEQREMQISTHTPHARRDQRARASRIITEISTHTPHARRDVDATRKSC